MAEYRLRRGYDIRLEGQPDEEIVQAATPERVAIKPNEFRGLKPRLLVREGDAVRIGTPLVHHKNNEALTISAPASGRVSAINRGKRRVLESIVIEPDGKNEALSFPSYELSQLAGLDRQTVLKQICDAGILALFTQRPFGTLPNPEVTPRDIFVSGFSSAPLAPNTRVMVGEHANAFKAGILAATCLTSGKVHLGLHGKGRDLSAFFVDHEKVRNHSFIGPHPAGNVGVQIHHIDAIRGRNDKVWTANVQDMILLGYLFLEGRVNPNRIVAVAGSGATSRKYYKTQLGAPLASLLEGKVIDAPVRYITGDVLSGRKQPADGFVGYHDLMVTVIPEATEPEFIGWMLPGMNKESFHRAYVGHLIPGKRFRADTRLGGGHRAMVATGYYEEVLPMDVYPQFLVKSILAEDFDEMEGLGIYELLEEDIALCEYICPSKTEMQSILRQGIAMIEKEG